MSALSRRRFVTTAALASAAPALPAWAAQLPAGPVPDPVFGDDIVRLDYNESPYGPSPLAVKALEQGGRQSGRYYYEQQVRLIELFARQNGIPEDHVAVFCGSRPPCNTRWPNTQARAAWSPPRRPTTRWRPAPAASAPPCTRCPSMPATPTMHAPCWPPTAMPG
ncbi:hypothetical protein QJS63_17100 [Pseudomonas juntendi]|nr:hypothetical protein QJS63_17100 [Pseudomonas juntendi]